MERERAWRRDALGPVAVLVVLLWLAAAACGDDEGSQAAAPTTTTPAVTTPATSAAPSTEASPSGLRCDAQTLLRVMKAEGGQFDLSPAALAAMTPTGPPTCDRTFARQTFAGPPSDPGPFDALFGLRPDRTGWGLVSVDCKSSVQSGSREVC